MEKPLSLFINRSLGIIIQKMLNPRYSCWSKPVSLKFTLLLLKKEINI